MKKIEAYIRPVMLEKVEEAIQLLHICGMSVMEAKGFGKEKEEDYPHHILDDEVDLIPKTKIEIICEDKDYKKIIDVIKSSAHTGRKGDGNIYVYDVSEAMSILTGEKL